MKCKNCGASITLTQKFCPNCGSPNEQSRQHIADMEKYDKKFAKTRQEVIKNSKWFIKYIKPLLILVVTVIIASVLWSSKSGMLGYDLAESWSDSYNNKHSKEIDQRLNEFLKNEEYSKLSLLESKRHQTLSKEKYNFEWNSFYNIAVYYSNCKKYISIYYDKSIKLSYYESDLSNITECIMDIENVYKRYNTQYERTASETKQPINNIMEAYRDMLRAYCNLTDEDIEGLYGKDQQELMSLLLRRMVNE